MTTQLLRTALVAASLLAGTGAHAAAQADAEYTVAPTLEAVDHIPALARIHGWHAVDRDSLIVWATPFSPYLVRIDQPSMDLKFANVIGLSEFAGSIHAKFDSVYVDGWKYRITDIYKLSRDDARTLY